ncbi:DUF1223 domain-containing protein [Motiliproteus coralliicola]|uniref:DUF1223 domain-containing protein n=1 Tax=Motiliproteus coralliicola TaxID=2283196 RepID=UPI000E09DC30|nr:DUF1223 domain-containing protein [Motiliproteus coralliicola]
MLLFSKDWSLLLVAGLLLMPLSAAAQSFQQQGEPPQLVELFTSEGCSSCPPADQRLSTLIEHPQLWRRFVPVAFHVDYWDYLGWQDPFADARFSQRQRDKRSRGELRSVYTPAFVVDGKEWRGFFRGEDWPLPPRRDGGLLTAELDGDQLRVRFDNSQAPSNLRAQVALLGFDLGSDVSRGENRGRRLEHQFVVLSLQQQQGQREWQFQLPKLDGQQQALAVWITDGEGGQPLQVLGGWID